MTITDVHTHHPRPGAIVNFDPTVDSTLLPGLLYSVGIHPWRAALASPEMIERVRTLSRHPQVVAIGETGLDSLRGDIAEQLPLFREHIEIARAEGLPLIIHAVKAWPQLMEERRRYPVEDVIPWIIHGFRGKPALARSLLTAGFYLSYGPRNNPLSLAATPADRLLLESDEAEQPARLPESPSPDFSTLFPKAFRD